MRRRAFLSAALGGLATVLPALRAGASVPAGVGPGPGDTIPGPKREKAIVYSVSQQRVWAVNPDGSLARTHLVSGRYGNPPAGKYRVFSKAPKSFSTVQPDVKWNYMVRFAKTPRGNAIGFHQIPVRCKPDGTCKPLQSEAQLGTALSSGCVRQRERDARWLYSWAPVGTLVIVER